MELVDAHLTAPTRVLVVDDEPSLVDAVSTALRYEGFDVTEATTGRAGLTSAQEGQHDLIVMDVMLPDLDGPTPRTVFVMGLDGLTWVEAHPGYDAYVVTHDDVTYWTDGFARYRSPGSPNVDRYGCWFTARRGRRWRV